MILLKKLSPLKYLSLLIFLFTMFLYEPAASEDFFYSPENYENKKQSSDTDKKSSVLFPVQFFRKFLSGADGNRCPMYPSCSKYCMDSVKKHGALMGWIMTCDRLMRCGRDELNKAPGIMINGKLKCFDPVKSPARTTNKKQ